MITAAGPLSRFAIRVPRAYDQLMQRFQLPRTEGCIVCGQLNPVGLKITSFVDTSTGVVSAAYTPDVNHIGFTGVVHGGVLATVLDEIMVWCATWAGKRFCLAAELSVRYRSPGRVGELMRVEARTEIVRSRIITTTGKITAGEVLVAEASGKYIPLPDADNAAFVATLVPDPATAEAARQLSGA